MQIKPKTQMQKQQCRLLYVVAFVYIVLTCLGHRTIEAFEGSQNRGKPLVLLLFVCFVLSYLLLIAMCCPKIQGPSKCATVMAFFLIFFLFTYLKDIHTHAHTQT